MIGSKYTNIELDRQPKIQPTELMLGYTVAEVDQLPYTKLLSRWAIRRRIARLKALVDFASAIPQEVKAAHDKILYLENRIIND